MMTRPRPTQLNAPVQFEMETSGSNRICGGVHEPIMAQYDPFPTVYTQYTRDCDTDSTDSGKPPSLSGKNPRPTSFRYSNF